MSNISMTIAVPQIDLLTPAVVPPPVAPTSEAAEPSVNSSAPPPTLFQERSLYETGALWRHRLSQNLLSNLSPNDAADLAFASPEEVVPTAPVALTPQQQADLAYQYSPIFHLYPGEDYQAGDPTAAIEGNDPTVFSDNATVDGRHVTVQGTPGTDQAGDPVVYDQDHKVMTDEAGTPLIHATQIPADKFMEIQEKNQGDAGTAPIIYQYDQGPPPTMTYWMFSPYNDGYNNHQGDWEGVTIEFSVTSDGQAGEPVSVTYSSHGHAVTLLWSMVPLEDGRPTVYVAEGSHAMSPFTADRPTDFSGLDDHFAAGGVTVDARVTADGQPRLRNIIDEPW